MKKEHEERALAILQLLNGMSIAEAQELLQWCSGCLLDQPVGEWMQKPEHQRETAPDISGRSEDAEDLHGQMVRASSFRRKIGESC